MKTVAVATLQDGMLIADDIVIGGQVAIKKGTKTDNIIKAKLEAFKMLTVNILEEEDLANTYYEKIRVSDSFKAFQEKYKANLAAYKVAVDKFIYNKVPFRFADLKALVDDLVPEGMSAKVLFSYINIILPEEMDLTYAHGLNSALICTKMGKWCKLSPEDLDELIFAGFVYDIGKFMLPHDIIWKPEKLNKMEFDLIKTHAFYGYYMMKKFRVSERVLNAILQHHERCDGSGYPQGLTRDEIDPFAKMIAIVDVYEAMTSARSYREPMNPYKVIEIIKGDMFQKYDISYISTFLNHILDELIGNCVTLSNGMQGEVIMNNATAIGRPVVKCEDTIVDLSQQRDINILAIV